MAVVVFALLGTAGGPAHPQVTGPDARGAVSLEVTGLDGIVDAERDLRIRVRVQNRSRFDRENLRVLVTVHRTPIGRFNYQQAMDHGVLGGVIHAFAADTGEIPAQGARTIELTQTLAELGLAVPAGQAGVYPLRIQLQSGSATVDERTTNLVHTPEGVGLPVSVALLLPLAAPPSRDGEGAFVNDSLPAALRPGGPLGGIVAALEQRPDAPVTLALDGLTLDEAMDLATGFMAGGEDGPRARGSDAWQAEQAAAFLGRLRTVADRSLVHLLALPYASADLVALERFGLRAELARHLEDGGRTVESVAGDRPLRTILWPPDGLNPSTLARMQALGTRAVVLSERYLDLPGPRGTRSPSPVRQLRSAAGITSTALVPDPWLEDTLVGNEHSDAVHAQRIIGEIATVYFEVPAVPERGLLLAAPQQEQPSPQVVAALLDGLDAAPFARPVTLATLYQEVAPEAEPVRLDYPGESRRAELPGEHVTGLRRARETLGSLQGLLVDDEVTPTRFDQLLLQAASVHYRDDPGAGQDLLATVTDARDALSTAVEVPAVPLVTLTNVEGELPVSIRSNADVPLRVLLQLRTASYDIDGGPDRELVLEPGRTEILSFSVRALRPGRTEGVQILVTDPDGRVELASGTVVVRSTAFSVAGVVVTVGAALFLLVWGLREVARRRSRGRDRVPPPRTGSDHRASSRSTR